MFSKASREKDGLQDWCLACSSKANSERRKILRLELGPDSVLAKKVDHGSEALVWCGSCKTNLPPSCFGLRAGKCKACASRQAKESRERKIASDLLLPATTPRKCSCCGEVKTIKDFHSGLYRCKSCQNAKTAKADARNSEKKKERNHAYHVRNRVKRSENRKKHRADNRVWWRNWEKKYYNTEKGRMIRLGINHKRRQAKRSGTATADDMARIMKQANGKCYYCGVKSKSLSFDHVVPLAKGGNHDPDNLVMACKSCNSSKGARNPHEFATSIGRLLI